RIPCFIGPKLAPTNKAVKNWHVVRNPSTQLNELALLLHMQSSLLATLLLTFAFALIPIRNFASEPAKVIELWNGPAPGDKGDIGVEADTTKPSDRPVAGKPVIRLGHVSKPTIAIYRPPASKDTGAAVMVCPGGAYQILAMDLEGTEVCDWLNSI